jgi:hypothetical protein
MPNDVVPQGSLAEQLIEKLNLPEIIAGPAGKAISRLIGEVADIPSAWIQRYTQSVKDGTEARTAVSRALASEVAKSIVADRGLVERATEVMLAKEIRKQANKEAVAKKTLEHLSDDELKQAKADVDNDWMNVFSQYAENASSERLQEIWGRVLAGEIRRPNSYSLKTLRFLSELDLSVAKIFEEHAESIIGGDFTIADRNLSGAPFSALLELQEFGLITGVGQGLTKTFSRNNLVILAYQRNGFLFLRGAGQGKVVFPANVLTRVGIEVSSILNPVFKLERAQHIVKAIPKEGLDEILLQAPGSAETILMWKKDEGTLAS